MKKEFIIPGTNSLPMLADIQYNENAGKQPIIIYAHGFCGFKDWGNFDLVAREFVNAGFSFLKFNFSHNGTTPETPQEFTILEAFGKNNYSIEIEDLKKVINFLLSANEFSACINTNEIGLIGHSMGGGISILTAAQCPEVKALSTWASIAQCVTPWKNWSAEQLDKWEKEGVAFYHNGRTQQELPLYYQLHQDFEKNYAELDIMAAAGKLKIPFLICHGTEDTSVPLSAAKELQEASGGELFILETDHVFGRKHPWESNALPEAMKKLVEKTIHFFRQSL